MFLSLRIENFKRFKSIEVPLEEFPLVIFGPNGSGKTQLLWSLTLFFRAFNLGYKNSTHKDKIFRSLHLGRPLPD